MPQFKKGNYSTEKLIIPADKKQLKLLGESREQTIISYAIYDCNSPTSQNKCPDTLWQKWKDNKDWQHPAIHNQQQTTTQ